jgi:hypothetical protein
MDEKMFSKETELMTPGREMDNPFQERPSTLLRNWKDGMKLFQKSSCPLFYIAGETRLRSKEDLSGISWERSVSTAIDIDNDGALILGDERGGTEEGCCRRCAVSTE